MLEMERLINSTLESRPTWAKYFRYIPLLDIDPWIGKAAQGT